jgi:hypothetical protein
VADTPNAAAYMPMFFAKLLRVPIDILSIQIAVAAIETNPPSCRPTERKRTS